MELCKADIFDEETFTAKKSELVDACRQCQFTLEAPADPAAPAGAAGAAAPTGEPSMKRKVVEEEGPAASPSEPASAAPASKRRAAPSPKEKVVEEEEEASTLKPAAAHLEAPAAVVPPRVPASKPYPKKKVASKPASAQGAAAPASKPSPKKKVVEEEKDEDEEEDPAASTLKPASAEGAAAHLQPPAAVMAGVAIKDAAVLTWMVDPIEVIMNTVWNEPYHSRDEIGRMTPAQLGSFGRHYEPAGRKSNRFQHTLILVIIYVQMTPSAKKYNLVQACATMLKKAMKAKEHKDAPERIATEGMRIALLCKKRPSKE